MARSKQRQVVYYNNDIDDWVDDDKEQLSLHPLSHDSYGKKLVSTSNSRYAYDSACVYEKVYKISSEDLGMAYDVAVRKFRRRMSKERLNAKYEAILESCLGKDIDISGGIFAGLDLPVRTCIDEMYDDGIDDKHYGREVINDYKDDIEQKVSSSDEVSCDVRRALSYI